MSNHLVQNFKDRVPTQVLPNGAIRYEEFDENGNSLGYKWIKRADLPTEAGNVWNKLIYDGIKEEFADVLYLAMKATQVEAEAGVEEEKYISPKTLIQTLLNNYLPSKQMSIKQGTISNNSVIPQTSGYSNYLYFVSMNSFEGYDSMYDSSAVCLKWQCEVEQSTRRVYARQKIFVTSDLNPSRWSDWSGTSSEGTNVSGTANYLEIAWN